MGRTYSVNGYLNAALRRKNKTILVEGPTDKATLHRIIVQKFPQATEVASIDHVGMIEDAQLSGLGHKARVLHIEQVADQLASMFPKIDAMLATLTDREWDGISILDYAPKPPWAPPAQKANRFITLGHSIENYHFEADCAKEYLKFGFSEHLTAPVLGDIDSKFIAVLVLATVVSIKLRDDAHITRCQGLIDMTHLKYENNRYYLHSSFGVACGGRSIENSAILVAEINSAIDTAWSHLHDDAALKWIPHGHIGTDVIWAGVAHIARDAGMAAEVVLEIARGHKKNKELFKAHWLSQLPPSERVPLDESVSWVQS